MFRRGRPLRVPALPGGLVVLLLAGCSPYAMNHSIQSNNRAQILQSEASQVRVRNAQRRVYDTTDRPQLMRAVLATLQDLGFQVEVLDTELGIISGKKFLAMERPDSGGLLAYLMYDEESLVVFNRVYRSWGPFQRRSDMVRLTVTLRQRNAAQMIVRASAQFYLRPVEEPGAYQKFFAALEKALLVERTGAAPPDRDGLP